MAQREVGICGDQLLVAAIAPLVMGDGIALEGLGAGRDAAATGRPLRAKADPGGKPHRPGLEGRHTCNRPHRRAEHRTLGDQPAGLQGPQRDRSAHRVRQHHPWTWQQGFQARHAHQ